MKSQRGPFQGLDLVFQLTVLLLVMTVGPLLLGLGLDHIAGTSPFATLCLLVVGVFGGTIAIYRIIQDAYKRVGGQK